MFVNMYTIIWESSPYAVTDFLFSQISVVFETPPAIVPKKVNIHSMDDNKLVLILY